MPSNPETGRTDRRAKTAAELLEFRLKQVDLREAKRGKQRASNSPDTGEPEGSGLSPSPLAGIGMLTLSSGGSSAAHTPAEMPTALPQPPLLDHHALASTSGLTTRSASKLLEGKTPSRSPTAAAAGEVPSTEEVYETVPGEALFSLEDPTLRLAKKNAEDIRHLVERVENWESWAGKVNQLLEEAGLL